MKTLTTTAIVIVTIFSPFSSPAQDSPPVLQPIAVLKRPTVPDNAEIDAIIGAEPSKYGKFRLEKAEECESMLYFDRTTPDKQEEALFKLQTCNDYEASVSELGAVELPFITPSGEEFHIFQIVSAGNRAASGFFYVIVIDKEKTWFSPEIIVSVFENDLGFDQAYIIQKQSKTTLSLVVLPTTKNEGETYDVSMGSLEVKRVDSLPRWAKSTRTFKIVGTLEEETGGARNYKPCISGKEISMEPSINPPTGDKEYCIDHIGACSLSTSGDEAYEGVPAEMTLLETVWSDGAHEYSCLYLKGL